MASAHVVNDPLAINLPQQIIALLAELPETWPTRSVLQAASPRSRQLQILSRVLLAPSTTQIVATYFRPVLLDLCARWLEDNVDEVEKLEALSLLVEVHSEIFPVLSAFLHQPRLAKGPLAFTLDTEDVSQLDAALLHRILLAYYRILHANRELPYILKWSPTCLTRLFCDRHPDVGVRFLAIRCYALQARMIEKERVKMEEKYVGDMSEVDCPLGYGYNLDGTQRILDGWTLPVAEKTRVRDARSALLAPQKYYAFAQGDSIEPIHPAELSPLIVNVHGILLLCSSWTPSPETPLVPTRTTANALQSLALQISLREPALLTSPPSCGKSLLLSHLSSTLYPDRKNQIVTIHLADTSLDPRSLLGSYVSSPTRPGTFDWKEGVLVRAMREGRWVVFEDIDRGTNEVLGLIKPLVESLGTGKWIGGRAFLEVPGRGRVQADEAFAVFSTRSLVPSRAGKYPAPTFFGAHLFRELVIPSPSREDLHLIVATRFPRLSGPVCEALVRLWEAVRELGTTASTRAVGLRELEKLCLRVNRLLPTSFQSMDVDSFTAMPRLEDLFPNPTIREDMFAECRDVFFGAGATTTAARTHMATVSATIAEHLGLSVERRDWVLHGRTPDIVTDKDVNGVITSVRVGNTRLVASSRPENTVANTRPFAMHKPAITLLSRIATAIHLGEPVLLTGETGTGKTSVITHLATLLRRPLIPLNMSNQTESSDIIGGFKPIDARVPASELQERFLDLFGGTFSRKKNAHFEESVRKAVQEGKWKRTVALWKESTRLARERIQAKLAEDSQGDAPRKRRKTDQSTLNVPESRWIDFERDVGTFEIQHVQGNGKFAYGFVEGPLVKALRLGHWILLDEVNLASAETLECISSLLHGPTASITLTEQGSLEPVPRHPEFRLFACMNPATDVGKRDLPPNIRSRFTEFDVPPPDADKETLLFIVSQYIGPYAVGDRGAIMDVAEFYTAVRTLAERREIADGSNHRPHFSMRTLARALTFAGDLAASYSLRRALWEGCLMAFTMILDKPGAAVVTALAEKHILASVRNKRSLLAMVPGIPSGRSADEIVKFGPFYLDRGPLPEDLGEEFIITPSVEAKLIDLARIIVTKRFPVLIEGPTSSGKTSSIEYLARRTGHRFVRINNHEHTDIQEYLGTYVSDPATGKLVFQDGLLVRALRNGDWIVLDELNLAPTDVLEALNRLLDDNRELVIPETQEVVRPHPRFMLFATQNPPGLYAGRKVLSRAFRNRFLEVHFDDVPQAELETILCQRCRIAPSYAQRIVSVFQELQRRRQSSRIFESKHGFATLRDLFRWAGRDAMNYQELADNGYMLLAERARREDDKAVVKEVVENIMKVTIDPARLYSLQGDIDLSAYLNCPIPKTSQLVWTTAMQRLFILVARALRFNEPILLVGETGCGKTSVCQLYAEVTAKMLYGVNCHQNTETADLIGGLRPLRNRTALEADVQGQAQALLARMGHPLDEGVDMLTITTVVDNLLKDPACQPSDRQALLDLRAGLSRISTMFEWHDGPLIEAMRRGDVFLMDEISLADDSVLERLNSVLEAGRTIVLAERGGAEEIPAIRANEGFKFVATMNPGGDYGKKELSPALRNRFTEIWVPSVEARADLELIVSTMWRHEALKNCTVPLLDFVQWLCERVGDTSLIGLRDILAWVEFSNAAYNTKRSDTLLVNVIFHHAAQMTFLDGLGSLPQLSSYSSVALAQLRCEAVLLLHDLAPVPIDLSDELVQEDLNSVQLGSFSLPKGSLPSSPDQFSFQAPTTKENVNRVVRACQLPKPVLLEGSPGVGKTSLVAALANICGYQLCRINLSDQSDLVDLFGSDLPVEGGSPGQFAWKDAEFLRALQEGHWVLLDEMNLAPQAVLEGLNAVLDHRGTVYIPELGRSFTRHPSFRIFAAQNPLHQGGGRKGLPKSFLNRFTKVYVQELTSEDVRLVCRSLFPSVPQEWLSGMIHYAARLQEETMVKRTFGREGAPWEFNLRDIIRWGSLVQQHGVIHPIHFVNVLFLQRFRNLHDRRTAHDLFASIFGVTQSEIATSPQITVSPSFMRIGRYTQHRRGHTSHRRAGVVIASQLSALEAIAACLDNGWLAIITGPRSSGKSSLVRLAADLTGNSLQEISINSATDATDILGSFEEVDSRSRFESLLRAASHLLDDVLAEFDSSCLQDAARLKEACDAAPNATSFENLRTSVAQPAQRMHETLRARTIVLRDNERKLLSILDAMSAHAHDAGRFEWVDGPLVRALKEGSWILLDGANLCNPSVLDRLNSLCENNGQLTLNEKGAVNGQADVVKPHPNFRLFMTVESQLGELSRAMRNRGVEISLLPLDTDTDHQSVLEYLRLPTQGKNTSLDNIHLPVEAELLRRGLQEQEMSPPNIAPIMSGELLSEDSKASSVASLLSSLHATIQSSDPTQAAALAYFTSHTIPPSHVALQVRSMRTAPLEPIHDLLLSLAQSSFMRTSVQSRSELGRALDIPVELLLAQALDPLSSPDQYDSTATAFVGILRLATRLYLFDHIIGGSLPTETHTASLPAVQRRVLEEIGSLSREVTNLARSVVESTDIRDPNIEEDASLSSKLLGFIEYLRGVVVQTTFDYSAIHVAARWLSDCALEGRPGFQTIGAHINILSEVIAVSSGAGLSDIWTKLARNAPSPLTTTKIQQLEYAANSLPSTQHGLRTQIFELMALLGVRKKLGCNETKVLNELETRVLGLLPDVWSSNVTASAQALNPAYLTAELGLLMNMRWSGVTGISPTLAAAFREVLQLGCGDITYPLSRLLAFQDSIWAQDIGEFSASQRVNLYTHWLEGVWHISSPSNVEGPSALLVPAILHNTVFQCEHEERTLELLDVYRNKLSRQLHLVVLGSRQACSRTAQVASLAVHCVLSVVCCFESSYEEETYHTIQTLADHDQGTEMSTSIPLLLTSLEYTTHPSLRRAIGHYIVPAFTRLCSADVTVGCEVEIGGCWIALARFLLELYVPNTPIDPAALRQRSKEFWDAQRAILLSQLSLHKTFIKAMSGLEENATTRYLQKLVAEMPADAPTPACHDQPDTRQDIARLHMYWSEVQQFLAQVLSRQKLDALVDSLSHGDATSPMREQVVQRSVSTFCQRLSSVYGDYDDINGPLRLAFLGMRLGLRLLAHSVTKSATSAPSTFLMAQATVAFPTVRSADLFRSPSAGIDSTGVSFATILTRLAAISLQVQLDGTSNEYMHDIETVYEQACGLWSVDKARAEEDDRQAQTLYRKKEDAGNLNEAEEEEEEFLSIFPEFEDLLDDDSSPADRNVKKRRPLVDKSYSHQLFAIHQELFLDAGNHVPAASSRFIKDKQALLVNIIDTHASQWSEVLDTDSIPFQSRIIHQQLACLRSHGDAGERPYDFYFDANVAEARKSASLIRSLVHRLEILIQEWPDQMVLQHIKSRCDVIMKFSLDSPLAKILSGLEGLIAHIDDWEMYANRNNSLKAYQRDLIALTVEWRRLELLAWRGLLDVQAREFETGVSDWWFRLYEAAVGGVLKLADNTDEDEDDKSISHFLSDLIPLLDDFMASSPLGQYRPRLRLFLSMATYLEQLSRDHLPRRRALLRRVHHILQNTAAYYAQFEPKILAALAEQQKVLEKEIRDYIKLASWKDVNVHALKQSAQKTHRKLYKVIRKFRDLLRQPVTPHIEPSTSESPSASLVNTSEKSEVVYAPISPVFPSSVPLGNPPAHLVNLDRTFRNLDTVISRDVMSLMINHAINDVEGLAVDIISTSKDLSNIPIPASMDAERKKKLQKNILTRKRKAWSDLLKELKRAGISANVTPEVLERNSDSRWLREQPILCTTSQDIPALQKSEKYLLRIQGLLPRLRSLLSDHHSDLSTRELQRAIMHVESGFALAVRNRSSLVGLRTQSRTLNDACHRLGVISACPDVRLGGPATTQRVLATAHACNGLIHSLREAYEQLQYLRNDLPSVGIPSSADETLQALAASLDPTAEALQKLREAIQLSAFPVLLKTENDILVAAIEQLRTTADGLHELSETSPILARFVRPIVEWLEPKIPSATFEYASELPTGQLGDTVIDAVLLNVQTITNTCKTEPASEAEERDNYIKDDCRLTCKLSEKLNVARVLSSLDAYFAALPSASTEQVQTSVARILPFLERYRQLVESQVANQSSWSKALFKLNFTMCSIIRTIAKDGFCQPPDSEGTEVGGEGQETMEGAGFGEGSGQENVSKEIQEESQVEGLQGEEKEPDEKVERAEEGNAVEMSEDFGGEMQDVPEEEKDGEGGSDEEEEGSDADPDEQIGDVDPDEDNAIDEKMWGDEKGPEDQKDSGKTNEDHSTQQTGESDMVAKDEEPSKPGKEKEKDTESKQTEDTNPATDEDVSLPDEEPVGPDGAAMDDHVQEADTLDLPEDLDMEMDQADQGEDPSGDAEDDLMDEDPTGEESKEEGGVLNDMDDDMDEGDDSGSPQAMEADAQADDPAEEAREDAVAQADTHAGGGTTSGEDARQDQAETTGGEDANMEDARDTSGGQGQSTGGSKEQDEQDKSEETPDGADEKSDAQEPQVAAQAEATRMPDAQNAAGADQSSARTVPTGQAQQQSITSNPLRSMGDALREISQRFQEIFENDQDAQDQTQVADDTNAPQVEYAHDNDTNEMQALGPAGQEEVAKLRELKMAEEEQKPSDVDLMDIDSEPNPTSGEQIRPPLSALQSEATADALSTDVNNILTPSDINNLAIVETSNQESEQAFDQVPRKEEDEADASLELEVRQWHASGHPSEDAEHIWRRYESLTHDLSYALCEQLRLILEPTQATRLKGDYRTGKRLNMKKIIPYIASEYTKDKIWLRRTRPSQREYQVLIALDDSRSMAESHSVHLAFQTLALVSKALGRLEVGDVAIAKFGEAVDVLHGFESGPFTDQAGTKIIDAFRFDQKATQVLTLLETSLGMLDRARERRAAASSTAGDLWQMEIIISDGVCQDHERLRTILRKAEEQRVMVVFIILDSLHSSVAPGSSASANQNSIVSMNQVAYKDIGGRMELSVSRYLDTFPFEYYAVVRNVESLPEVLSGTLKQFFERISED